VPPTGTSSATTAVSSTPVDVPTAVEAGLLALSRRMTPTTAGRSSGPAWWRPSGGELHGR
jgi:hypothetical protein